jgi:hypothetical protein
LGWRSLPEYLENKKAIVNIQNNDNRCFGYALLYFLEHINLPEKNAHRPNYYTQRMFADNHIQDIPYPISPNDVHKYEDVCQIKINLFTFFDDEGRSRHPLYVSRKNYPREANLLYWNQHYALIAHFNRLFGDITKTDDQHHFCMRCLGYFNNADILARHQQLCTREDFVSTLHVLPAPDSKQAHIRFMNFKTCTMAPFVIYADFESILEPMDLTNKQTHYTQKHKLCAAAAIISSKFNDFNGRFTLHVGPDALFKFLDDLIQMEKDMLEMLKANRRMNRLSRKQQEEYDAATNCHLGN